MNLSKLWSARVRNARQEKTFLDMLKQTYMTYHIGGVSGQDGKVARLLEAENRSSDKLK